MNIHFWKNSGQQSHKPKGRPPLSADVIRYALRPKYKLFTSWHDNVNKDVFPSKLKMFYVKMLFQDSKNASDVRGGGGGAK